MKPIRVETHVARPAPEVFEFISDFENNPRWQRGMTSCRWTSPPPHQVGATYDQVAHFLGRDIKSSFKVIEHEPSGKVKITSTAGPFPISETRTVVAEADDRSRVTAVVEGNAGRFFWIAGPVLRLLVQHSVRGDYARLKGLLEGAGN